MIIVATAEAIFWSSLGLVLYVYAGYPLLVYLLGLVSPKKLDRREFEPFVSLVITAFNEERDIRRKLENTLSIKYPPEKLEVIVASDCSTDGTDEIVGEFSSRGVQLLRQSERRGKTSAQNYAVERAKGEIVLFSDATTLYEKNVLRALLPSFSDQTVGCVAGKLVYVDESGSAIGKGSRSYWDYETLLKESESRTGSLIGVSGCLYAVRRSAYVPMYPEACSDFLIATLIRKQGLRTVFEQNAVCTEEANRRTGDEMSMRIRIISQTFNDLWTNREMLNPFNCGFFAVQLISHKVLRYAVPFLFLIILATSATLALHSPIYVAVLVSQILLLLSALVGWLLERSGKGKRIFAFPLYFMLANIASVAGFYQFLRGKKYSQWQPLRKVA